MNTDLSNWIAAYKEREDLAPFGSAGLALFAMALKFGYVELSTIGADAVVDGPDDKGCDVVYVDLDQRRAIIAQSYRAETPKVAASDAKAATLRQGASYLLEIQRDQVPERIRPAAQSLRDAIQTGSIDSIHVWFVHNCPGSENVKREVSAVEQSIKSIVSARFNPRIDVFAEEISSETLSKLYNDTNTPILVNKTVEFERNHALEFSEGEWDCVVLPMKLRLLRELYINHKTDLFSANVRDFLGVKSGDSNINYQMQKSLSERPENFFVYNNGLTILTHAIKKDDPSKIIVNGLSIVNGAQTTGTIGTSKELPPEDAFVLVRFISTTNEDLIADVVRYNNSQNSVTASDFRSTDPIQRRLVSEMQNIPDAEYDGGRRGGVSAAIKRRPKLLPSYSVGQALASFHGTPATAYNEKSAIWSRDALYSRFFNENLSAQHIVFVFSLLRSIEEEKNRLRELETKQSQLAAADSAKLAFYRKRGSVFLLAGAIGECLETILDKVVANRFSVSFGVKTSPNDAMELWKDTVSALSGLHTHLEKALNDGLKNQETVAETLKSFSQLVASLRVPYSSFFDVIKGKAVIG
ncbi:hypothetical protein GOZ89_14920 [Agrobacterium vitis]|uniref:AIPR family protein n=1 Tax=Agrobacterium vitis TaxID=373 RepID=UPI0012E8A406|nr:AIPR family protein [Agrobacterium vitis]MVA80716.1 hypothetical protein [Agrobacterium vitis]